MRSVSREGVSIMKTCKCKCLKGKCGCKHKKKFKKIHVIPILALITCFQLLAPKNIKKSLPGKALKYSLACAWGCVVAISIIKTIRIVNKGKKKRRK